ncbi:cytochrome P450 oxidoreductase [Lophiotrema nucula]|uniref:Cytochrome P450 oxidoreductase n=1 Tax=Lophiotrema nucula TaxID=690887 RepID=A0A6A5ZKV9_9PLEO|nr:cytochrome P450 oxidoreductase [Lophiotrema nucula]
MLTVFPPQTLVLAGVATFLLYYAGWVIYTLTFHPYAKYPGPLLAKITTWHRWYTLRYQIDENVRKPLHDRYGEFVRIAPDEVQISDPYAIDTISKFAKTDFYDNFDPGVGARVEIFAEKDERKHNQLKKLMFPLFRQESVAKYEGYVENILALFCQKMEEEVGEEVDLAKYIAKFSWDTVGEMIYSYEGGFGMLRDDIDYNGWMSMVKIMQWQTGQLGYVPYLIRVPYFLFQLLISGKTRKGLMGAMRTVKQLRALIRKRREREAAGEEFRPEDMLSKMLRMEEDEKVNWVEDDIVLTLNAFVWAGSDTTGSVLGMIVFFILSDKRVYRKLQTELHTTRSDGYISYQAATELPYLDACVNEGLRLHGILGIGFPRAVPTGGAEICGQYFPGGYKVSMNQNVTHLDKAIFGEDADDYRPERWMVKDEETVKAMHRHLHTFGYGNRSCLGKPIAMNEIYKFVPTVLSRYSFEVLKEPTVTRGWFQQPEGFVVKVSKRD